MDKDQIRRCMLDKRRMLDIEYVNNCSNKVKDYFIDLFEMKEKFLLYVDINKEIRTKDIIDYLYKKGKEVYLPKYNGESFDAVLYEGEKKMIKGNYGIMEPAGDVKGDRFDIIAIPGVAFDENFYRLGMGKGFYDRMLKRFVGLKVGLAYQFQIMKSLPFDDWDEKMDMIITEDKIYRRQI
ncbi:MAG: 5-formyltetrahydrofolate cyclo-ligase [Deferribacterales bacterium]